MSDRSLRFRAHVFAALAAALSLSVAGVAHAEVHARHQALKSHARSSSASPSATGAFESLSAVQLEIAKHVFTGRARCEAGQSVDVEADKDKPGFFHVSFNGSHFLMVPEATASGAVRLFDRNAGVLWLQIPVKSMLMNQKKGERMLDGCVVPQQSSVRQAANTHLVQ